VDDYFSPFAAGPAVASQAPSAWPAPPQPPWGQPWAPTADGSSAAVRVLIWIGVAVGAIIMIGIMAAIVIPLFLSQRGHQIAERTVVSVPTDIEGMPPLADADSAAYVTKLTGMPGPGEHVTAGFGANGVEVYVGAARNEMSAADGDDFFAGVTRAERLHMPGLAFREASSGSLGGRMTCSRMGSVDAVMCLFADEGSYGLVLVSGAGNDAERLAVVARESFVHRR